MTKISNLYSLTNYITADASGKIGIGTSSPILKLQIEGDTYSTTGFFVRNSAETFIGSLNGNSGMYVNGTTLNTIISSGGNYTMTLTSAGNVGIGTTSPGAPLEVRPGTGANFRVRLNGSNNLLLQNYNTADAYRNMQFAASTLQFLTGTEAGNDAAERMRVTAGGSLLIGTASQGYNPATQGYLLGVKSSVSQSIISVATSTQTLDTGGVIMGLDSSNSFVICRENLPFTLWTNNTERMRITSVGDVLIGTTSNDGLALRVEVAKDGWQTAFLNSKSGSLPKAYFAHGDGYGAYIDSGLLGNSNLRYIFKCVSNNADRFFIRGDGLMVNPPLVSTFTTSSGANLYADPSNGAISRSTSSIKYKKNVEDYTKGLDTVMQLRPVSYEGKSEMDAGKNFAGLIAEEVHDLGLTEFVQYAADGSPDALAYQNMIALAIKAIQELSAKVTALENK